MGSTAEVLSKPHVRAANEPFLGVLIPREHAYLAQLCSELSVLIVLQTCHVGVVIDGRRFGVAAKVMIGSHSDQHGHVVSGELARVHQ